MHLQITISPFNTISLSCEMFGRLSNSTCVVCNRAAIWTFKTYSLSPKLISSGPSTSCLVLHTLSFKSLDTNVGTVVYVHPKDQIDATTKVLWLCNISRFFFIQITNYTFQDVAETVLLYGCTNWTRKKLQEKKQDGNDSRMLRDVLNKFGMLDSTKHQHYDHFPPI